MEILIPVGSYDYSEEIIFLLFLSLSNLMIWNDYEVIFVPGFQIYFFLFPYALS